MAFFKLQLRNRNKSPSAKTVLISNPIPGSQSDSESQRQQQHPTMDHENRRSPPTPLRLRGDYHPVNTASPLKRIPSSPLPPLPSYDSSDDLSARNYSDGELGYSRGIAKFEPGRSPSEDTNRLLSPATQMTRSSVDTDILTEMVPLSTSPPKLKLSFESTNTDRGSVYDIDTPPNHRVSLNDAFKTYSNSKPRHASPERILTSPAKNSMANAESRSRQRTSSSGTKQLRRSSAVYSKRRGSLEVAEKTSEKSSSIKSGSTVESPEDRDSGFHEDFDEALRSKQSSPDKHSYPEAKVAKNDNVAHHRETTNSPPRVSFAITPERAPLIPSDSRVTPLSLTDHGVRRKTVEIDLPQIARTETFKETFSTNLFENTILADKDTHKTQLLSPKPIAAKGKVMTAAEFERLRQQEDDDSDDEEEEEDVARDENYQIDLTKQRQRQQAALSVYRLQMTKVVGASASPNLGPQRPLSQIGETPEDESEEIPLGILMAHGFPQTNNRPHSRARSISQESKRTPSPANLPVFAKHLPVDPHAMGLPRSHSSFDLRPVSSLSSAPGSPHLGPRTNSAPGVPLLDTYQTRQRKGAMFMDPNAAREQSFFQQIPQLPSQIPTGGYPQYEMMGMQPVPGQGMVQYVPVMVSSPSGSPSLGPTQPPTLMQELYDRQKYGVQQRQNTRATQIALQHPQQQQYPQQQYPQYQQQSYPQPFPPIPGSHTPSMYQDTRRSIYDRQSIYSSTSQLPTARPKLPSSNPAYRLSSMSNAQPGRYRASTYGGTGLGVSPKPLDPRTVVSTDDEDGGWEALRRKKEEMQARRMTRMQTAA